MVVVCLLWWPLLLWLLLSLLFVVVLLVVVVVVAVEVVWFHSWPRHAGVFVQAGPGRYDGMTRMVDGWNGWNMMGQLPCCASGVGGLQILPSGWFSKAFHILKVYPQRDTCLARAQHGGSSKAEGPVLYVFLKRRWSFTFMALVLNENANLCLVAFGPLGPSSSSFMLFLFFPCEHPSSQPFNPFRAFRVKSFSLMTIQLAVVFIIMVRPKRKNAAGF